MHVDNDPIVLAHARALLTSSHEGKTAYVDADLKDPGGILSSPALRDTLDLNRPVGLMLIAIMHFVPDQDEPYSIVRSLLDALPSGSYLALSHLTGDLDPDVWPGWPPLWPRAARPCGCVHSRKSGASSMAWT